MFHKDILTISYENNYEIRKVFKEILGLEGIAHFSIDIARPDSEMIFLSSTPAHGYEICKRGLAQYDGIISPDYYRNFEFYWWKDAAHKAFSNQIKSVREGLLGLKHGFMLVRKWNNFHIIYSFATKTGNSHFESVVINKINEFLKMGDYAYNEIKELYGDFSGKYEPPLIDKFYPFEGGQPPSRYSKDFRKKSV